jgi:D-beta-D-heptose 7-phosphate kinase/D-beta-D-heptose 1-phosphate adenosyltransferase
MKVIFTNGCFDVLHRGHIELLQYAKSLGDYLVVGINSNESVRALKGETRPINDVKDRKLVLESIKYVDAVVVFNELTPLDLIRSIKPSIIVKGGDYTPEQVIGHDLCEVRIFKYLDGYSTTSTIERMKK